MYELGLAHSLGKRTVMITKDISTLPFDLRAYRANSYSTGFRQAPALATLLGEIGAAVVNGMADFSNPVQDFAPGALDETPQVQVAPRESRTAAPDASHMDSPDDEEEDRSVNADDLGLLDGLQLVQEASERVANASQGINEYTSAIGDRFKAGTDRLQRIQKNLGPDRALQPTLAELRTLATDLNNFSDAITPLNEELQSALLDAVEGANAIARFHTDVSTEDSEAMLAELAGIESLSGSLVEAYIGTSGFAQTLAALPPMQAQFTAASRRAAGVVADTAAILEDAQASFSRVEGILRNRTSTP
ncbi:hypothetical protein [Microbacterium sp.]|uniref:hypothetical protein n=1 Tax=Microbacterium sp. TaxID=51671 RepID=UPI0039E5A965